MRLDTWQEPKKVLLARLNNAIDAKKKIEGQWADNERILFKEYNWGSGELGALRDNVYAPDVDGPDDSGAMSDISYTFKNVRFIHSQIATNPPAVNIRPSTGDQDDAARADIADRVAKYSMRQYQLKEPIDLTSLNCIVYGTGILKHDWNDKDGDIIGFDPKTEEMLLSGDLSVKPVNPWKFYIDPDAVLWKDAKYVFEEIIMDWDQAVYQFPDKIDILKQVRIKGKDSNREDPSGNSNRSNLENTYYDSVVLFQYWEKGMPHNGMLGRYALITKDGDIVDGVRENPHAFTVPRDSLKKWPSGKELPKIAKLPYSIMTDIDVPNTIWGKSFVEYAGPLQDYLNEMDTISLENCRAHGVTRGVLPENCDVSELTDSSWDLVKIKGVSQPTFINPPKPMPEMINTRNLMKTGIDDMSGVNESMFGQQSREMAGFAMQYATNQGNMIRHRLFIKYSMMIENMYNHILQLFAENWDEPRTIKVIGEENAYEIKSIKGSDFSRGYDITVEYGTSLSLDPITRRQEIMQLLPIFEKAGRSPEDLLDKLRLNDLPNMYEEGKLAKHRQQEIFNKIIEEKKPVPIKELQDHKNMLLWAYKYIMTSDFEKLDAETQELINQNIIEREELVAARAARAAGGGVPPGPAPGMPAAGAPQAPEIPAPVGIG